jgi:hypothetical protein
MAVQAVRPSHASIVLVSVRLAARQAHDSAVETTLPRCTRRASSSATRSCPPWPLQHECMIISTMIMATLA